MLEQSDTNVFDRSTPIHFKYCGEEIKQEIYDRIRFLKNGKIGATYEKCIAIIKKEFNVLIGRHNVYSAIKSSESAKKKDELAVEIVKSGPPKKFSEIDEIVKKNINKKIIELRSEDAKSNTYERCISIIEDTFNVEIKRHNVYNAVKNKDMPVGSRKHTRKSSRHQNRRRVTKKKKTNVKPRFLETYYGNISYYVHNVVFSGTTNIPIDIEKFVKRYANATYNPRRFPGIVLKLEEPRATILLFKTGKFVIVGLKEESEINGVRKELYHRLKQTGLDAVEEMIVAEVNNIVITTMLPHDENLSIDLNKLGLLLENCMYEPEVFPGLMYRHQDDTYEDGKAVFLIFSTGKVVCVGIRKTHLIPNILKGFLKKIYSIKDDVFIDNKKPKEKIKLNLNV